MIIIIAKTRLRSLEDRDLVFGALRTATLATLHEPGVISYQHSIDHEDRLLLNSIDIYISEEAVSAHNASDHIAALASAISGIEADINLKAYRGNMEPFDLSAMASAAIWADTAYSSTANEAS
jgi:quinol monooxygenase YgiN